VKKKYFTDEERKEAIKKRREKYRRKKGILPRITLSKEEKLKRQKERQKKYYENHKKEIIIQETKYYENHKKEIKNRKKLYRQNNKEKIKIEKKKYYQNNKEKIYTQINNKLKTDIHFKLAHYLRSRIRLAIKNNQKSGSAVKDLGCSIPEFKTYLESKWKEGMNWDNYGFYGWHIDHIIPLDSFNLQNRKEFLKACHYTNLQPLWAGENLMKSNKTLNNSR